MKDAEDEYEKAEKRLQEQLRETKEQLNMAQRVRVLYSSHVLTSCVAHLSPNSTFDMTRHDLS